MNPQVQLSNWAQLRQCDPQLLIKEIQRDIIASPMITHPPFGKKKSIYTDFFASSKPLRRFEAIMAESVLPLYANTHTSTTSTSKHTSQSVKLARETISRCTRAITTPGHEHQAAVIFTGCAEVVVIPEDESHRLNLQILEQQLILYQHRPLKIGTFSAGSNLTGVLNDTVAISELLHKYGAFAFFDYAGVGPYTSIDMNPTPSNTNADSETSQQPNFAYKDGVFISTHKFLGGPGASGVLVARLEIFSWMGRNSATDRNEFIPMKPGGGTVDIVFQGRHKYTNNVLAREEAGTPNILATIRTGLVFRLQEIMDPEWILQKEYKLAKKALARLCDPKWEGVIQILGASEIDRVAVFSLTIAVPRLLRYGHQDQEQPLQIHYGLLSTIMNDFFGVEMRGGCMCAGPYASQLLRISPAREAAFWKLMMGEATDGDDVVMDKINNNDEQLCKTNIHQQHLHFKGFKPGFVRFSFSYFARDKDVDFVIQSLEWMAEHGYLLIPLYKLDAQSGEWSIREAVRKVVCAEIQLKRMFCCSRDHCIPAAVDCIYGLQKLFQEQMAPTSPYLTATNVGQEDIRPDSNPSSNVFSSVNQAKQSMNGILSAVLHRSLPSPVVIPVTTSTHLESDDASSMIVPGEHGNIAHLPQVGLSSSEASSINSGVNSQGHDLDHYMSQPLESHYHRNSGTFSSTSMDSTIADKAKRVSVFSMPRRNSAKYRQIQKEALQELSRECLQDEVNALENSTLAKELRWFVTPLEVAELYTRRLTEPSLFSTLPFPKRVK
ncbi:hypothetical protein BGZ51_008571 [Haplosporangium sp. Z 767]|nr:hypothetical protein BGZ51_008571 [Haplosporangium sp. Z 767]